MIQQRGAKVISLVKKEQEIAPQQQQQQEVVQQAPRENIDWADIPKQHMGINPRGSIVRLKSMKEEIPVEEPKPEKPKTRPGERLKKIAKEYNTSDDDRYEEILRRIMDDIRGR